MTTYNTGNALGSSDARDLYDNAENIDNFANGSANTYQDRLGVTRKSLAGMRNAFDDFIESSGYTVPVGYTSGIVLSEYNQLIEYSGEFYKLKAGQAPYTTTGTWGTDSAKLVSVGDATLRQELTANANDFNLLPEVGNYAALRAYTGPVTAYYVRCVANTFDGGAGVFRVDAADTTTADNGGTVLVDAAGRRWKRELLGVVKVPWFGYDTDAVQSAIDTAMPVVDFCGADYSVDIGSLSLRSNQVLDGNGATISSPGETRGLALFTGRELTGVHVKGFRFETHNSGQVALLLLGCDGIKILGNTAVNCGLVVVGSSAQPTDDLFGYYPLYSSVTPGNISKDIEVSGNYCTGDSAGLSTDTSAILFTFAEGVIVHCNVMSGYRHGVMWWGGDAAPTVNGAAVNERKVKRASIHGNICSGMAMGDIWGSMGSGITVTANFADYSGDVGIDFEGCVDCLATGNVVYNRTNGALALGFINNNVRFSGNIVIGDTSGTFIVNLFGDTDGTFDNKNLAVTGNTIRMIGNSYGYISGPASFDGLQITDNALYNISIDFGTVPARNLSVERNTINLDWAISVPLVIVGFPAFFNTGARSSVTVKNNTVNSTATQTQVHTGVYGGIGPVFSEHAMRMDILDNDFTGASRAWLIVATDTDASAANLRINIKRNYISQPADPVLTLSESGFATVCREDNSYHATTGSDFGYPYNAPSSGKWFAGERSYNASPSPGGSIGYVCVTTGIPGVWKPYGGIDS